MRGCDVSTLVRRGSEQVACVGFAEVVGDHVGCGDTFSLPRNDTASWLLVAVCFVDGRAEALVGPGVSIAKDIQLCMIFVPVPVNELVNV